MSERSASATQKIKTYLQSTMTQSRLNNVMLLHIHKHLIETIDHNSANIPLSNAYWFPPVLVLIGLFSTMAMAIKNKLLLNTAKVLVVNEERKRLDS